MKYKLLLLMLILSGMVINASMAAESITGPRFEQRTYPYYWNTQDKLTINLLSIGQMYGVLIGANQPVSEQQWINFTATNNNVQVNFRQNSAPYTNESTTLTELFINLYQLENNSQSNPLYIDQLILPVIYASQQANTEALVANSVQFGIVLGLIFMGTFGFIYAWRRIRK